MSGKFQRFNTIDGSIEMLKYKWISKNFNSNEKFEKHFTSLKEPSAWQKLFSPPPDKSFLRLWSKNVRTEIYKHLLSKSSENAILGRLEMVLCNFFFWHQPEICFWLCCGSIFFYTFEWFEVFKMSDVFWAKLYCKMSDLSSFYWVRVFLAENLNLPRRHKT